MLLFYYNSVLVIILKKAHQMIALNCNGCKLLCHLSVKSSCGRSFGKKSRDISLSVPTLNISGCLTDNFVCKHTPQSPGSAWAQLAKNFGWKRRTEQYCDPVPENRYWMNNAGFQEKFQFWSVTREKRGVEFPRRYLFVDLSAYSRLLAWPDDSFIYNYYLFRSRKVSLGL